MRILQAIALLGRMEREGKVAFSIKAWYHLPAELVE